MAAVWSGAPVLGRAWSWWGLVGVAGLALTVAAGRSLAHRRSGRATGTVAVAAAVFAVLVGAFSWGLTHSVEVDGRLYLETSATAQSYRMAEQLVADRVYFGQVDELLGLDPATARTRFRELEPAQRTMQAIADRWNLVGASQLPDGAFAPVVENARAAAYFGALAVERKIALLGVQDDKVASELESYRTTFVQNAAQIGPGLASVSEQLGIELPAAPGA